MKVAFQGEPGAYSEQAVFNYFGEVETVPCESFDVMFDAVVSGRSDAALAPIENSLAGSIHRNYDLLLENDLHIVGEQHGKGVAQAVCEQFMVDRVRSDRDRQRVPLQVLGAFHHHLIEAAELMEAHIEEPLSLDEVAARVGLSRRQIERLFKRHLGTVPSKFYLEARLRRARTLLLQTTMSIMEIAVACGFESPPHFSRCYRSLFGCMPSAERRSQGARPPAAGPRPRAKAGRAGAQQATDLAADERA